MRIVRRYLAVQVLASTLLVFVALILLFSFFDLIQQLSDAGVPGYRLSFALVFVLLSVPGHMYELFPVAALLGTLFALAQLVLHSEYTIMRVSGVSMRNVAASLAMVGAVLAVVTFLIGEFITPLSEHAAQRLRLKQKQPGNVIAQEFRSGLWVKDYTSFVNVARVLHDATLQDVKIYEFDDAYRLRAISRARQGAYVKDNVWRLRDVTQTRFEETRTTTSTIAEAQWRSVLTPEILSVLLVPPDKMSLWTLFSYVGHLRENNQDATRYEIALWNKLVYPLAVIVMMLLALPFAYFNVRQGGVSAKIFAGIMLGLGFHLLNRLFTSVGRLTAWPPLLAAVFPTLVFLCAALAMLWWVERHR